MLHLGSIGGTTIRIDLSFLILVALFVFTDYDPERGIRYALLWIPVLFVSVLIHELAHAAMIGVFGYGSSEIVLGGIGGVTMNRRRAKAWHDVIISIAGPLSSFALAWLIGYIFWHVPFAQRDPMMVVFLPLLRQANVWWGLFNLIPVSPLDGGQAVRSFFRIFMKDRYAFVASVWIAMIGGGLIAIAGLLARWIFLAILIAWYVFMNFQQWQYYRRHGYPGD